MKFNLGFLLILFFFFTVFSSKLHASSLVNYSLAYTYDDIQLNNSESMGLVGGNYLFDISNGIYSGLGVYGAVKGQRGGFFVGGVSTGWRKTFYQRFFIDANFYLGGGGGGSAPQGGGLMLRSSIEMGVNVKSNAIGLGYSYVEFPNGDISSDQFSVNYRHSFSDFHFAGRSSVSRTQRFLSELRKKALIRPSQFSLQVTHYYPKNSVAVSGKSFDKRLDILGIRWRNQLLDNLWFEFETGGAMLGNIDGFAQVLSGVTYDYYFNQRLYGSLGFMVGAAGGGDVNTDGGLVYRPLSGFGYHINDAWSIKSEFAWTAAVEGEFSAFTGLFNLVYHYKSLVPRRHRVASPSYFASKINWQQYRIRPGVQRYSHYRGSGRKSDGQENIDVNLVNLKLDRFITSRVFLTGQAIGAFTGKAGGYAVGLVGPGYQFNSYLSAELLLGVAGGGGIAVGSGQILQPMLNFHVPLTNVWGLEASVGYIGAVNGKLSALASNVGLSYYFQMPVASSN